jgi:hypothetical protein
MLTLIVQTEAAAISQWIWDASGWERTADR